MRLLHGIDHAQLGRRTDFAKPFFQLQKMLKRRGITVVISDFFESPEVIVRTMEPLRFHGTELVLFHLLDPDELLPRLNDTALLIDMETEEAIEVSPEYARSEYPSKIQGPSTRGFASTSTSARGGNRWAFLPPGSSPAPRWSACLSTFTCCGSIGRLPSRSVR
jgi:hypothetical protein